MTASVATAATLQTGHVGLNVSDVARSARFYQHIFGFEVVREGHEPGREFIFLGDGQRTMVTLWQQSQGRYQQNTPGLHHLAFQVDDIAEVHAAEERLRAAGVEPLYDGVVPHREGAQSGGIFFLDPDGIRLEIYTLSGAGENPAPHGEAPTCGFF